MRVYLPGSHAALVALADGVWAGPHDGVAVTEAVRSALDVGDEDAEYAVTCAAAEASAAGGETRRVVVVVEADDVVEGGDAGAVRVPDVYRRQVQALLVDAADLTGDPADADGLGWYALQELDDLLRSYA